MARKKSSGFSYLMTVPTAYAKDIRKGYQQMAPKAKIVVRKAKRKGKSILLMK